MEGELRGSANPRGAFRGGPRAFWPAFRAGAWSDSTRALLGYASRWSLLAPYHMLAGPWSSHRQKERPAPGSLLLPRLASYIFSGIVLPGLLWGLAGAGLRRVQDLGGGAARALVMRIWGIQMHVAAAESCRAGCAAQRTAQLLLSSRLVVGKG